MSSVRLEARGERRRRFTIPRRRCRASIDTGGAVRVMGHFDDNLLRETSALAQALHLYRHHLAGP